MDEEPNIDGEVPGEAGPAEGEGSGAATPGPDALTVPAAPAEADATAAAASAGADAPLTPERVLDIAIGVAVLAGEAIDRSARSLTERAKEIQQQAPEFIVRAEERGRPLRENLFGISSDEEPAAAATQDGDGGPRAATNGAAPPAEEAAGTAEAGPAAPALGAGLAESLRNLGSSLGLLGGGGAAGRQSAEDEIRTLEGRVHELEQVVASGRAGAADEASAGEMTAADGATYVPGNGHSEDALADSPYAVSETPEEQRIEASDAPAEDDAAPQSPRAGGRKRQRDFDSEVADAGGGAAPGEGESAA